jgi:membrane associated rhomboid family serine protease
MNNDRRRRHNALSPILMSLLFQLYQQLERSPYKPPITIALLGVNIVAYIHPNANVFGYYLDELQNNCLHPLTIIQSFQRGNILWNRILLSSIIHADDYHLYYNMTSLLWKGIHLEKSLGSYSFAFLVLFSLIVSHSIMILLSYLLFVYGGFSSYHSGMDSCAVGFSAVLFSLKYVWNTISPETTNIMGMFKVPSKYAAWIELVLISLLTPNASFIGHLAGILAGYLYLVLFVENGIYQFPIPRFITNFLAKILGFTATQRRRYVYSSGRLDQAEEEEGNIEVEIGEELELEYVEDDYHSRHSSNTTNNSTNSSNTNNNHNRQSQQQQYHSQSHQVPLTAEQLRLQRLQRLEATKSKFATSSNIRR